MFFFRTQEYFSPPLRDCAPHLLVHFPRSCGSRFFAAALRHFFTPSPIDCRSEPRNLTSPPFGVFFFPPPFVFPILRFLFRIPSFFQYLSRRPGLVRPSPLRPCLIFTLLSSNPMILGLQLVGFLYFPPHRPFPTISDPLRSFVMPFFFPPLCFSIFS